MSLRSLAIFLALLPISWAEPINITEVTSCYMPSHNFHSAYSENAVLLPDLTQAGLSRDFKPTPGKSIFFHETSCVTPSGSLVSLTARQACAIESAARHNPDRKVYVLFSTPRVLNGSESAHVKALDEFENVIMLNVALWEYAKGTPIESWLATNALFFSQHLPVHLADLMRLLTLYKYGGMCLDLDTVVLKNLDPYWHFVGAENEKQVSTAVMHVNHTAEGRALVAILLREFEDTFDGSSWDANGPQLVTRILQRLCNLTHTPLMTRDRCNGFMVQDSATVAWDHEKWTELFEKDGFRATVLRLHQAIIAHLWNGQSSGTLVKKGDGSAYDLMTRVHCPEVYSVAGETF